MLDTDDFSTLEKKVQEIITSMCALSSAEAGYKLADLCFQLLQAGIFDHQDGAKLAISLLKGDFFGKLIFEKLAPGVLLHATALRFLEPITTSEIRATEYLQLLEGQRNFNPKIDWQATLETFEGFVPPLRDPVTPALFDTPVIELLDQFSEAQPSIAGVILQQSVYLDTLREAYYNKSQDARIRLLTLQIHFPLVFDDPSTFGELYIGFVQAWFRHIVKLRRWFQHFSAGLDDAKLERMRKVRIISRLEANKDQVTLGSLVKKQEDS